MAVGAAEAEPGGSMVQQFPLQPAQDTAHGNQCGYEIRNRTQTQRTVKLPS